MITVLILLLVALILFATEKIPVDVVGLILIIALVLTGVLSINEAVEGFGDSIIITIAGLFVLTGGLIKTGIVDLIGRRLHKIAGNNELFLTGLIMVTAAASASVLKNTTTTAMFLPVIMGLSQRTKIPASRLLMPLAFGAILGGSCTLIGTSTNLAVSGAFQRYGYEPYSMFELAPVGIVMVAVGILYMLTLGRKMLPFRGANESLTDQYDIRSYVSELIVLPESRFVGKTLGEAAINSEYGISVLGIVRADGDRLSPSPSEQIKSGDLLIVEGGVENILRAKAEAGIEIDADFRFNDRVIQGGNVELFEIMVMRNSRLIGQSLKRLNFRQIYDLTVLAINRHGDKFIDTLSDTPLKFGDVLLVQGNRKNLEPFVVDGEILLLQDVSASTVRTEKRKWAIAAFLLFLGLSLSKVVLGIEVPLAIAVLLGVMLLLATKTVRYTELYSLIDFRLLVLIACMMSFGVAMEKTGTDKFLADQIVTHFAAYGGTAVLAGFFLMTVGLTQPMSNQAAALVVLPVAVKTAVLLGLNPRTFAVGITYAASFSFMTPLEPACVLVYTPGRYKFMDFVKIGTILTVVVFIVSIVLVPIFWKL